MQNGIFQLDLKNVADACVTAVVVALAGAALTLVSTSGFSLFTAHWVEIGKNMTNLGFIALVVSIGQALLSTNKGSVLGISPNAPQAPQQG